MRYGPSETVALLFEDLHATACYPREKKPGALRPWSDSGVGYRCNETNSGSSPTRDQPSGHAPEQCLRARQYEFEAEDVSSRYEKQQYHPQNDCHNAERNTMPQKARWRFSRDKSPTYQNAKPKHFSQRDKTISNTEQPPLQQQKNASSKIELEGLPSDSPPRNSGGMLRNLTLLCNFAHGGAESIRSHTGGGKNPWRGSDSKTAPAARISLLPTRWASWQTPHRRRR